MITTGIQSEKAREQKKSDKAEPVRLKVEPKVIHQVEPSYPEELRRGIGLKIGLRITINEEGIKETHYSLRKNIKWMLGLVAPGPATEISEEIMDMSYPFVGCKSWNVCSL